MKKLLLSITLLLSCFVSKSNDFVGGSITWTCLPTGNYVFQMEVFRNCSGTNWNYQNEVLNISGTTLPSNGVIAILMQADSGRWASNNFGSLSPFCSPSIGSSLSCVNGDSGAVQLFYYVSNPIQLTGAPAQDGWNFTWEYCCRDSTYANVNVGGAGLLRSTMYSSSFPCMNSSPKFRGNPETIVCRGAAYIGNVLAVDDELDSLVHSFGEAWLAPASNPTTMTYRVGYSQSNPMPNTTLDINNIPASLNPHTGEKEFAVFNGTGIEKYLLVEKVDAYRKGIKTATVYREFPVSIIDCPTFPNGTSNIPPEVSIDGVQQTSINLEIIVGQEVAIPIQVIDNDVTGITAQQRQLLTIIPDGIMFSKDKKLPDRSAPGVNPCFLPSTEPCAYLKNQSPFFGTAPSPQVPLLQGTGSINTEFVWQTGCNHIGRDNGSSNPDQNSYNFFLKIYDELCPVPNYSNATLNITVKAAPALEHPIVVGASVNLDGSITYGWIPPLDSSSSFKKYEVESARPPQGTGPVLSFFQPLDLNLSKYGFKENTFNFFPLDLINPLDPNSGYNLLSPSGTGFNEFRDYYLRMRTISGCFNADSSMWSNETRLIELEASPGGVLPSRDSVLLTWNTTGISDSIVSSNVVSQSKRKYIIYTNDSVSQRALSDSSNWYPVGETYDTTFITTSGVCNDYAAFRVEAIDTIVVGNLTYQSVDSLKTIVYSTFSYIDTLFIHSSKPTVLNIGNAYLESSIQRDSYQWINCQTGVVIPNEMGKTFVPSQPGFYQVVASSGVCSDTSACFEVTNIQGTVSTVGIDYLTTNTEGNNWKWVPCNSTNTLLDSGKTFIPLQEGSYAVRTQKFGFTSLSNCFSVDTLDIGIQFAGLDSILSLDSNVYYQWNSNCLDSSVAIIGATQKAFIPQAPGKYSLSLSAYGYSENSNCFLLKPLNNGINVLNNDSLVSLESTANYQWFNCGTNQNVFNADQRILTVPDTGSYAVIVSAFGYSDTSDCVPMYAVGLEENLFQHSVSIFPNPTSGTFTILLKAVEGEIDVQIRDIQGRLVQKDSLTNNLQAEIEILGESGVYFVQVTNTEGEQVNLKLIKQ